MWLRKKVQASLIYWGKSEKSATLTPTFTPVCERTRPCFMSPCRKIALGGTGHRAQGQQLRFVHRSTAHAQHADHCRAVRTLAGTAPAWLVR